MLRVHYAEELRPDVVVVIPSRHRFTVDEIDPKRYYDFQWKVEETQTTTAVIEK